MNRTSATPLPTCPGHPATGLSRQTASPIALSVNGLHRNAGARASPASPPFGHSPDTNRTWSAGRRPTRDRLDPVPSAYRSAADSGRWSQAAPPCHASRRPAPGLPAVPMASGKRLRGNPTAPWTANACAECGVLSREISRERAKHQLAMLRGRRRKDEA